jgi:hypothetical protein
VLVDDLLDDRQAQAGAARLGRHVGFEDARHDLGRETRPVIGDDHLRFSSTWRVISIAASLKGFLRVFGVAQQIMDDLPPLVASPQTAASRRPARRDRRVRRLVQAEHLADQRVEVEARQLGAGRRA